MKIRIDFRFWQIEYELSALQEYIRTLESQLPILEKQEREQLEKRVREQNLDEGDRAVQYQQYDNLIEWVLPRFFRGQILITLWAIYESAVIEIADYIREKQGVQLTISDIRADAPNRAKKYFEHILKFPLIVDDQSFETIQMLYGLRNALAHANGRVNAVNENEWNRIKKWHLANAGIVIDGMLSDEPYLMFTSAFIQEAFSAVRDSLHDLMERTRKAF